MDETRIDEVGDRRFMAIDPAKLDEAKSFVRDKAGAFQARDKATGDTFAVKPDKPKKVPARHRHLTVDASIDDGLVDKVVAAVPAKTPEAMRALIMTRLHYLPSDEAWLRRRVARFIANARGRRMPLHIKEKHVAVRLLDLCIAKAFDEKGKLRRALVAQGPMTAADLVGA